MKTTKLFDHCIQLLELTLDKNMNPKDADAIVAIVIDLLKIINKDYEAN